MSDPLTPLLLAAAISTANVCEELTPVQIEAWAAEIERFGMYEVPPRWVEASPPLGDLGDILSRFNELEREGYPLIAFRLEDERHYWAVVADLLRAQGGDMASRHATGNRDPEFTVRSDYGYEMPWPDSLFRTSVTLGSGTTIGLRPDHRVLCVSPGGGGERTKLREG